MSDDRTTDQIPAVVLITGLLATLAAILPAFLVGAVAVQMGEELDFGVSELGVAVAAYFTVAALSSVAISRGVQRRGPRHSLLMSCAIAAIAALGLAVSPSVAWVGWFLALGGLANSAAQPGVNLLLAEGVPQSRQGLAFGIKQSGMPLGTLLGGLAVPVIAQTVGWRWGFVGASGIAVGAMILAAQLDTRDPALVAAGGSRPRATITPALLTLMVGAAFGAGSVAALGTFLVSASVDSGMAEGTAGLLLSFGSLCGILMRLLVGRRADRVVGGHLRTVALMLAGGLVAFLAYSVHSPTLYFVATIPAFGLGWAWPGLFNFAVVDHNRAAPAAATGVTQTGTYTGAVLGPLVFGAVAEWWGYPTAWRFAAGGMFVSILAIVRSRNLLRLDRDRDLLSRRIVDREQERSGPVGEPS